MISVLLTAGFAYAQACICSRNVALPGGSVSRPWELGIGLDYGASISGDDAAWRGLSVTDRYGDSMAGMYMPPHVIQTAAISANVGLPEGFSAGTTLPYMSVLHVAPSEMPGDVDNHSFADMNVVGRWGKLTENRKTFFMATAGVTLPTGTVVADTPVRAGKGAVGGLVGVQTSHKISPYTALAAAINATPTLFTPADRYRVGSGGSLALGTRWSPRENGRVNISLFGVLQVQDTDQKDALVYKNTGYTSADLAVGFSWNIWAKELRSLTLTARAQAPVWQIVGDPMYAENFTGGLGAYVVAF